MLRPDPGLGPLPHRPCRHGARLSATLFSPRPLPDPHLRLFPRAAMCLGVHTHTHRHKVIVYATGPLGEQPVTRGLNVRVGGESLALRPEDEQSLTRSVNMRQLEARLICFRQTGSRDGVAGSRVSSTTCDQSHKTPAATCIEHLPVSDEHT